ncbi:ExbD/TolR family protein [Noviherbaspirillum suwonense]|uniref:Outer membrane transport energization protein ExbD n=1 Tax=Noviherbaspirillum suwonense TaxID=1224511 RepID=A0ABY1QDZ4_9BURK|nr:biopolymer transporter ExbD [Noviherbaspirillum suwonense]SMP67711.1 outer membrane transport energization protein ExbD [Noviherbaspirillum suwonense]
MAMGSLSDSDDDFNPEINTTPLVDVMLVLLIIFIITIPVINQSVKIDLPRASSQPQDLKPENINLDIDAQGQIYWNREAIDPSQLQIRIATAAQKTPQPELHLRAERTTQYEKVAQVMAAAQTGGLSKIGFITEPEKK